MQQLSNQAQEFWFKLIDSDAIKLGIDLVTDLLGLVTDIIDKRGTLTTLGTVGGAILGAKNLGRGKMSPPH